MSVNEEKIALIVEAVNRFKGTFDELQNNLKGVDDAHRRTGQQSESMFQKMKANWVEISVVVAEVVLVVREAWEYMADGAKAQQAEASFRAVAAAAGESADEILEAMKRAANGTIDDSAIMQKAVKGMAQGLSGEQMIGIMEAARTAARVSGQDISTAYETITDAIANKMPRALKQYGLVTKEQMKLLEEAMAMGVTEVDLYALAMENAANQTEKIGPALDNNAEKLQRWKAIFMEIKETIGKAIFWIIDNVIGRLFNVIANVSTTVADLFARVGALWSWMSSGFSGGVAELSRQMKILDEAHGEQIRANNAKYSGGVSPATGANPKPAGGSGASQMLKDLHDQKAATAALEQQMVSLDIAEKTRDISHLDAAQKRVQIEQAIVNVLQKQYDAKGTNGKDLISDPNARAALAKQIDDARRKITDFRLALRELNGDFQSGFTEGLRRYIDSVGSTFQQAVKLAQSTAQAMEQAFSDFFFDAFTGKLKHFSDYLKSFFESVARAIANMMAQKATAGLVSSFVGSGSNTNDSATVAHGGALLRHSGGYVPRFHTGGLNSDERMVINKVGERYITQEQNEWLTKLSGNMRGQGNISVAVNVENKSSQPVDAKVSGMRFDGKAFVVGVILSDLENDGPIRGALAGGIG